MLNTSHPNIVKNFLLRLESHPDHQETCQICHQISHHRALLLGRPAILASFQILVHSMLINSHTDLKRFLMTQIHSLLDRSFLVVHSQSDYWARLMLLCLSAVILTVWLHLGVWLMLHKFQDLISSPFLCFSKVTKIE